MNVTTGDSKSTTVREKMLDLRDVRVGEVPPDSPWTRTVRVHYMQDGRRKSWDVIRIHDSVSIVVFNASRGKLVFVRQFRPAVYYQYVLEQRDAIDVRRYPATLGLTLELCAGIVDKDKPLVEIAREELQEECGYEAPATAFTEIITYRYALDSRKRSRIMLLESNLDFVSCARKRNTLQIQMISCIIFCL